jgi:hypothetical protein
MATTTPNYGFYKPATTEFVNVLTDLDNNWDTVDTQLKAVSDSVKTILMVRKTIDEAVTSSVTLQADDQLFLPVAANSFYQLDCFLMYTGAADPAGGFGLDWTGPAGFSMSWASYGVNGAIAAGSLTDHDVVALSNNGLRNHGSNNVGTVMSMRPAGVVATAGTAGTLTLRWAQGASNATATTLKANSFITLTKF